MKLNANLSGHTSWTVLDSAGRAVASGSRHNLITNAGLDAFADETGEGLYNTGDFQPISFGTFRACLRVGTGSGPPTNTKTALTAEIASAASSGAGGFGSENSSIAVLSGNTLLGTFRQVRVCSFTAPANITEYGLSAGNVGALSITELFRDAQGNPVSISVSNGYQLKVTHDLKISLPFAAAAGTLNLGTGVKNINSTFWTPSADYINNFLAFAPAATGMPLFVLTAADGGGPTSPLSTEGLGGSGTPQAYVSGQYRRTRRYIVQPASGNRVHYGWLFPNSVESNGFKVAYNGTSITKTSSQRLTLDLSLSWARG